MTDDTLPFENLSDLLARRPSTKIGQVRAAWPFIRAALDRGHPLKDIWERLQADGVDIGYRRLSYYIEKIQRSPSRAASGAPIPPLKTAKRTSTSPEASDAAANLRAGLNRSTGFDFQATARKEDLI